MSAWPVWYYGFLARRPIPSPIPGQVQHRPIPLPGKVLDQQNSNRKTRARSTTSRATSTTRGSPGSPQSTIFMEKIMVGSYVEHTSADLFKSVCLCWTLYHPMTSAPFCSRSIWSSVVSVLATTAHPLQLRAWRGRHGIFIFRQSGCLPWAQV